MQVTKARSAELIHAPVAPISRSIAAMHPVSRPQQGVALAVFPGRT